MKHPALQVLLAVMLFFASPSLAAPLIIDHSAVDKHVDIPQYWIDQVKKMWLNVPGESHSLGYRLGLSLLESADNRFQVNVAESGTPEAPTDLYLRISRATWGDVSSPTGWRYGYGEEDWFTSQTARDRTKSHITYSSANGREIAAIGFGWCWDMTWHNAPGGTVDPLHHVRWAGSSVGGPEGDLRWGLDAEDAALTGNSVSLDTYLAATDEYIEHCRSNNLRTVVFYTTGPVDGGGNTGESGLQRHLKNERIREHVRSGADGVLFDYADILCWSDAGQQRTVSWVDSFGESRVFPAIHADNTFNFDGSTTEDGDHIGQRGALRLGKALWYMLARMAGWDGTSGPANSAPLANNDNYSVPESGSLNVSAPGLLGNDTDAEHNLLTAVKVDDPTHGTLTIDSSGSFTYVHDGSATTSDSFTYRANDGLADSNVATVSIAVTPANPGQPPAAPRNFRIQ